jgi:chromosome segregation ATPase
MSTAQAFPAMPAYNPTSGSHGISDRAMEEVYGRPKPPVGLFRRLFPAEPEYPLPQGIDADAIADATRVAAELWETLDAIKSLSGTIGFYEACRDSLNGRHLTIQSESGRFDEIKGRYFSKEERIAACSRKVAEAQEQMQAAEVRRDQLQRDLTERRRRIEDSARPIIVAIEREMKAAVDTIERCRGSLRRLNRALELVRRANHHGGRK